MKAITLSLHIYIKTDTITIMNYMYLKNVFDGVITDGEIKGYLNYSPNFNREEIENPLKLADLDSIYSIRARINSKNRTYYVTTMRNPNSKGLIGVVYNQNYRARDIATGSSSDELEYITPEQAIKEINQIFSTDNLIVMETYPSLNKLMEDEEFVKIMKKREATQE